MNNFTNTYKILVLLFTLNSLQFALRRNSNKNNQCRRFCLQLHVRANLEKKCSHKLKEMLSFLRNQF